MKKNLLWDTHTYKGREFDIIDHKGLRPEGKLGAPGCDTPLEAIEGLYMTLQWFLDRNPYADTIVYRTLPEVNVYEDKYFGYCRLLAVVEEPAHADG